MACYSWAVAVVTEAVCIKLNPPRLTKDTPTLACRRAAVACFWMVLRTARRDAVLGDHGQGVLGAAVADRSAAAGVAVAVRGRVVIPAPLAQLRRNMALRARCGSDGGGRAGDS